MRHVRTVLPLPRPLDRPRQIDGIFDDARIDQHFPTLTEAEAFDDVLLCASRQSRRGQTERMFLEVGGVGDERVAFPMSNGMPVEERLARRRMLASVEKDRPFGVHPV